MEGACHGGDNILNTTPDVETHPLDTDDELERELLERHKGDSMILRRFGGNREKRGKNRKRKFRAENKEKHWDFIKLCKKTINEQYGEGMKSKINNQFQ